MRTPSFIEADDDFYVRLDVYLAEGGLDKDLNGYTRGQAIGDLVGEYERHLHFFDPGRPGTAAPYNPCLAASANRRRMHSCNRDRIYPKDESRPMCRDFCA